MKSKTETLTEASNSVQRTLTLTSFPTTEHDNEGYSLLIKTAT